MNGWGNHSWETAQSDSQARWQEFLSVSSLTLISRAESAVTDLESPFRSFSISTSPPWEAEGCHVWAHPQSPLLFSKALYKPKEITETQISCLLQGLWSRDKLPLRSVPFSQPDASLSSGKITCPARITCFVSYLKNAKWIWRQSIRKAATDGPLRADRSRQV